MGLELPCTVANTYVAAFSLKALPDANFSAMRDPPAIAVQRKYQRGIAHGTGRVVVNKITIPIRNPVPFWLPTWFAVWV